MAWLYLLYDKAFKSQWRVLMNICTQWYKIALQTQWQHFIYIVDNQPNLSCNVTMTWLVTNVKPETEHLLSNSLTHGGFGWNFRFAFKLQLVIDDWGISCEVTLRWMSLDRTDDKPILVQVMVWCRRTIWIICVFPEKISQCSVRQDNLCLRNCFLVPLNEASIIIKIVNVKIISGTFVLIFYVFFKKVLHKGNLIID